jgi:hypothetical protein
MAKVLLAAASTLEAVSGLALIIAPSIVMPLLGTNVSGAALVIARIAGFGLVLLGIACWPRVESNVLRLRAMLIYNLLATATLDTFASTVNQSENFCCRPLRSTPRWQFFLAEFRSNIQAHERVAQRSQ